MDKHKTINKLYLEGYSGCQIAKKLNCTNSAVYYSLTKHNILRRSNKENYAPKLNHSYFKDIVSERQAYWLGLIAADGQIQECKRSSKALRIDLIASDQALLSRFLQDIEASQEMLYIFHRHKTKTNGDPLEDIARIVIKSDEMCLDLFYLGITPRKTFTLKFPVLADNLVSHFCRGYFDGDGCITIGPTVKIVGTEDFIGIMQQYMLKACNLNKTKLQIRHKERHNNIRTLEYGGKKQVARIRDWLYNGATIWMTRKRKKFNALLD